MADVDGAQRSIRLEKPQLAVVSQFARRPVLRDFRVLKFVFAEILSKLYDAETAEKIRRVRVFNFAETETLPTIPIDCDFLVCD